MIHLSGEPTGRLELALPQGKLDGWFPEATPVDGGLVWDAKEAAVRSIRGMLEGAGLVGTDVEEVLSTWGERWIDREGVRIVFVAPADWSDGLLPWLAPGAASTHRVVLGRVEVMTPEFETTLLSDVQTAFASDDRFDPGVLGRVAAPILGRLAERAEDGGQSDLATHCRQLAQGE